MKPSAGVEYNRVAEIKGPLLVVDKVSTASFEELVEVEGGDGKRRLAMVLETGLGKAIVQVFEGTSGLSVSKTKVRFLGHTMQLPVSDQLLGRVFDGLGRPLDELPEPMASEFRDVNGEPINPERRDYPADIIQTGISTIDGMLTLVRGQKLPIFSGAGMPHNRLAAQIAKQATVVGKKEEFAVVFAAIGVSSSDAEFFRRALQESGAIRRSILYLNLADDPAMERIITPRVALTAAEYLAFDLNMHVLVIITDMTNYAEALREISAARDEVPGRRGFPGYLYTDLAAIYERAGRIKGRSGSITQLPILSMPSDDVTHPIPDLTGYITEGQVFLGRELFRQGIYPPIYVLSSLSRLMGPAMNHIVKEESRAIERILRLLDELKTKSAREKVSNGDGVVEEIDGLISSIKATRDKVGSGDEGLWDVVERGMKSLASSFKPETNPTFKTLEDEFEGYVKSGMGSLVDQLRQLGPLLFQLYNAYTRAIELRALAEIVGKASLTLLDQEYLTFGDEFERNFVNQGYDENRALQDTLNIAWQTISCIRKSQLTNISQELLNRHYVPGKSRD